MNYREVTDVDWQLALDNLCAGKWLGAIELIPAYNINFEFGYVLKFVGLQTPIEVVFEDPDSVEVGTSVGCPGNKTLHTVINTYKGYMFRGCNRIHTEENFYIAINLQLDPEHNSKVERIYIKNPRTASVMY